MRYTLGKTVTIFTPVTAGEEQAKPSDRILSALLPAYDPVPIALMCLLVMLSILGIVFLMAIKAIDLDWAICVIERLGLRA